MADTSSRNSLPEFGISQNQIQKYRDAYINLMKFAPPRAQARADLLAYIDAELLERQEQLRRHRIYPKKFDVKTGDEFVYSLTTQPGFKVTFK